MHPTGSDLTFPHRLNFECCLALNVLTAISAPTSKLGNGLIPTGHICKTCGCYAVCDMRSMCDLLGRTKCRLGYIGPATGHTIEGTAHTPRLNHLRNYRRTASLSVMTTGRMELLSASARSSCFTGSGLPWPTRVRLNATPSAITHVLSPIVRSARHRRHCRPLWGTAGHGAQPERSCSAQRCV